MGTEARQHRRLPSDWSEQRLGTLCALLVPMRDKPKRLDGDVPWIRIEDFAGKYVSSSKSGQGVDAATIQAMKLKVMPVGTVLCSCSCNMGVTAVVERELVTNQTFIGVVPNDDVESEYLYYLLGYSRRKLDKLSTGTTIGYLPRRVFENLLLPFPPLPEQRKIAAILSSVDNAIEKTQAVIDQVQVVKRGLMQELLTRGLPGQHTRFKRTEIGEIPEEWDIAPLGTRVELQPGFAFKSADFSASGDRLLRGSNVGVGHLIWTQDKTKYFPSTRRGEASDYELRESDLIVAMDRPFISDGFKVARVTADDLPALLLQRVGRFRKYRDMTPDYLWHLLQSHYVKEHLQTQQKGTDLPHISKTEIESSTCPFPPVDEQERIAKRLDALDGYTTALGREQEQGGRLKAGLMTVLLTGELRVTPENEAA